MELAEDLSSGQDRPSSTTKQAACLECRRSKTKCIRDPGAIICRKCEVASLSCIIPAYHVGRYKGVKNKRTGLEKAISQVEQALKKARHNEAAIGPNQAQALEQLLRETSAVVDGGHRSSPTGINEGSQSESTPSQRPYSSHRPSIDRHVSLLEPVNDTGEDTVNNADNPLHLLAIASAIPKSSARSGSSTQQHPRTVANNRQYAESETQTFFRPLVSSLDISSDVDPISLGLVTEDEAHRLFAFFYASLAHTRWGLDPRIHSSEFVRSRSSFLLTSIMAASALFLPDTAALSMRLRNHVRHLVQTIILRRHRSMEIVLAFMINVPWMHPGSSWAADDDTCYYISVALTMALDLNLNRIVLPSSTPRSLGFLDRLARADCIDASKALALDGFSDMDTSSEFAQRLLRTRERIWLALFNLDRGVCLARGRSPTVPSSPLLDSCDSWHMSEVAEPQDGALVSSTVLRRDYTVLVDSIRATCDRSQLTVGNDPTDVKIMREKIERFFEQWFENWRSQIQQGDGNLPPYVEILASHTKLSAYCAVINHPTAPADVKQFFQAAGLASALNVIRVSVEAETRLRSMPNNTVIMVSFAACFVLGLGHSGSSGATLMAPNTRSLIEEAAGVLERIGSTPAHRNGASALFGKHIKTILQQSSVTSDHPTTRPNTTRTMSGLTTLNSDLQGSSSVGRHERNRDSYHNHNNILDPSTNITEYPILDISDEQIIEVIMNSKHDMNLTDMNFHYDEYQFLDWLETHT